jgi:hypothetical protein
MKLGVQATIGAMAPAALLEQVETVRAQANINRSQFVGVALARAIDEYNANPGAFLESFKQYENNGRMPIRS